MIISLLYCFIVEEEIKNLSLTISQLSFLKSHIPPLISRAVGGFAVAGGFGFVELVETR